MNKPILFSGEMVLAILDRRKTQTRRVIKPQPQKPWFDTSAMPPTWYDRIVEINCRYGRPGDLLWVRETWMADEIESGLDGIRYRADNHFAPIANTPEAANLWSAANRPGNKWRPSIFMPRWASRITLRVLDVWVERVQDISEGDAISEGVAPLMVDSGGVTPWGAGIDVPDYRSSFIDLWDSINAKRGFGWDVNPFVWVVKFEVEEVQRWK